MKDTQHNLLEAQFALDLWNFKQGLSPEDPNPETYGLSLGQAEGIARQVQIEFEQQVKRRLVSSNKSGLPARTKPAKVPAHEAKDADGSGGCRPFVPVRATPLGMGRSVPVCGGLVTHPLSDVDLCSD